MRLPSLAAAVALVAAVPSVIAQTATTASVLDGAYNEEQALRGQALYYLHCISCHGETMAGLDQAPPLAGPQFSGTWEGEPLEALVDRIATMPPERPNSLTRQENVDMLAYILWYNGLPIGDAPLGTEHSVLSVMTFEPAALPPASATYTDQ